MSGRTRKDDPDDSGLKDRKYDFYTSVVDALLTSSEKLTEFSAYNKRIGDEIAKIPRQFERLHDRLEKVERQLSSLSTKVDIGERIDRAVGSKQTRDSDLEAREIDARAEVEKAKLNAITSAFEQVRQMFDSPAATLIFRIVLVGMLTLNLLPPGCRAAVGPALTSAQTSAPQTGDTP